MSPQQEARQHPRFTVRIDAVLQTPDGTSQPTLTKDVSGGGICLVCQHPLPCGSAVKLALSLILGDSSFSERLVLPAHVVWCTALGSRYQVGARFDAMSHQLAGQMEMLLRFLEQEVMVDEPQAPEAGHHPANPDFDTGDADKI